ncbi:MAG: NAD(P)/FAD-dependent oxidoreductase [bacterium]|nr:NAD(P)/FAD-dependent oxidoreductase [bacterium]
MWDACIIGGGPVGIFGAFYSALRGMKTLIIDSLEELGGQVTAMYPEKDIIDVAGFARIKGKELIKELIKQLNTQKVDVKLAEYVEEIKKIEDKKFLITTNKNQYESKGVIITVGIGRFTPKKHELLEKWENKGVVYFVKDYEIFRGKDILIVGGGDSAVDWGNVLVNYANKVTLIHRRQEFRAVKEEVVKLYTSGVEVLTPYELKEVNGKDKIDSVIVFNNKTMEERLIKTDYVISCLGFQADTTIFKKWGLEVEGNGIKVNPDMSTSIKGIYAAGDCAVYPGKVKLIVSGFGEVATAVCNLNVYLDPSMQLIIHYSTKT